MNKTGETCITCAAFSATTGECRRHAPVMVPVPTGPKTIEAMGLFPATRAERWCIEYVPDNPPGLTQ